MQNHTVSLRSSGVVPLNMDIVVSANPSILELELDPEQLGIGIGIGVLVGFTVVWLYGVFQAVIFGRGVVRGQPPEHAPGEFVMTSFGRVHYYLFQRDCERETNSTVRRPLVVLIHGFAGSCDVFTNPSRSKYAIALDEAGFDVLTFDNYGHGYSDGPDTEYSVELYCAQLAELLVLLGLSEHKFYLFGLSMGASVAVSFAHRHTHLVHRLILQAPSVMEVPLDWRLRVALRIPFVREIACRVMIPTFGEGANLNNLGVVRATYRLLQTRLRSGGSWGKGDEGSTVKMLSDLGKKLPFPVFVMWGEADSVIPFSEKDLLMKVLPRTTLLSHPRGDHMEFADGDEEIREFFRTHLVDYCLEAEGSTSMQRA